MANCKYLKTNSEVFKYGVYCVLSRWNGINNSIIRKLPEKGYGERVNGNFTVEDVLQNYKKDDNN